MLADADFRVRFRASSSAPKLFQVYHDIARATPPLFKDIADNLTLNLTEEERVLTQILANSNIMIASNARRRAPLVALFEIAEKNVELREPTIASLTVVAARLGLPSLSSLYLEYARYMVWLSTRNLQNLPDGEQVGIDLVQQFPYRAAGFANLREARRADFTMTGSWLLQNEHTQEAFKVLCNIVKLSPQEGRLACLAQTVALVNIRHQVKLFFDPDTPVNALRMQLQQLAEEAGAGDAHMADILLSSIADDVVVETLAETFDQRWKHDELLPALEVQDRSVAETFQQILHLQDDFSFAEEPTPPFYLSGQSVGGAVLFSKEYPVFNEPAAVLSVVHKLLSKVHSARFVPQQQRHLFTLSLALSLSHRILNDVTILEALVAGLVDLLPQVDLVLLVSSILRWSFDRWLKSVSGNKAKPQDRRGLSEQLVCAAHATVKLRQLAGSHEIIDEFANFLDTCLSRLCALNEVTATEACILWPHEHIDTTAFPLSEFYAALASPFAPISKFAFVNKLKGRKDVLDSPESGRMVWRLMQSIQAKSELSSSECLAFADLVFESRGSVQVPTIVEFSTDEVKDDEYEPSTDNDPGIKQAIVRRVLRFLKSQDRRLVSTAFDVAKLIFSTPSSKQHLDAKSFDPHLQPLVTHLSHPSLLRPQYLRTRTPRQLDELAGSDWLERGEAYDRWVCDFAELLSDVRAEGDGFYAQLVPLIKLSPEFASRAIPHLLHSILLQAYSGGDPGTESSISRYFDRLLRSPKTSLETNAVLVRVATYLRRHPRIDQGVTPASRFDRWLGVSWVLLAAGAVRTGSHLDGLLFLELAHEYDQLFTEQGGKPRDRRSDEQAQALLYEIYSQIDEPDGFYGRESHDVRESLVSRYRHEGRWTDAFRTYGSRHEAQSRQLGVIDRASTAGVVTSLASFGFNRLAMSVLQPARLEGSLQEEDLSADLPYELAWRTDVWDLPVEARAADTSSAVLYSALRASRSGRSIEVAQESVQSSLVTEIGKLSKVGLNLPSPDSKVVSTILALREVYRLIGIDEGDQMTTDRLKGLSSIPSTFR